MHNNGVQSSPRMHIRQSFFYFCIACTDSGFARMYSITAAGSLPSSFVKASSKGNVAIIYLICVALTDIVFLGIPTDPSATYPSRETVI